MVSQGGRSSVEFDASSNSRAGPSGVLYGLLDLVVVTFLSVGTIGLALVYGEQGGPAALRVPLGFLFIFFVPGYALTAALFPRGETIGSRTPEGLVPSALERVVLSVGLSLALVPLVSLGLTLVSQPIGPRSVLLSLGTLTIAVLIVAAVRRLRTLPRERFSVSPQRTLGRTIQYSTANVLNVVLVIAIALAVVGIGAAIVDSGEGDSYSELSLLSDGEDGPVADDYSTALTTETSEPFHVEVANNEHRDVEYTVVVLLEELDLGGDVVERDELDRFSVELAHGERVVNEHEVEPTMTGEDLRLSYLLYIDDVPENPAMENADLSTYLFVDVDE